MPTTARGALPFPLGGDTPDVPRDILALANRLAAISVVFVQDIAANRPAANAMGGAGFLFYATNSGILSYSDGAAWHDVNSTNAVAFTDAPGTTIFQEGVNNPGEGVVTRLSNAGVRVTAGSAWIDGDGVVGAGRYPCSWVQTDLTGIPAAAAGASRVDRIVVQLNGQYGVAPTVRRLAGVEAAGVSLDTRPLGAIPGGHLHLADVLVDNTGVVLTSGIRSRRTFSGGWKQTIARYSNAGGTNDYSASNLSWAEIDAVNLSGVASIKPGNMLEVVLSGTWAGPNPTLFSMYVGNASLNETHLQDLPSPAAGWWTFHSYQLADDSGGVPGVNEESLLVGWTPRWADNGGGPHVLVARPANPAVLTATERPVGPTIANTHDH